MSQAMMWRGAGDQSVEVQWPASITIAAATVGVHQSRITRRNNY